MEEWKKKYPGAFIKEYDPVAGLRFNAWVEGICKLFETNKFPLLTS